MNPTERIAIAERIVGQPTAPLFEHRTAAAVEAVASDLGLAHRRDAVGNVLVGEGREWCLAAHLDHPAFWVAGARLQFQGGVRAGIVGPGAGIVIWQPGVADPVGRARLTDVTEGDGRLTAATLDPDSLDGEVPEGGFATWDLPLFSNDSTCISAVACDDLVGVAASLCALAEAGDRHGCVLATRGEEIGFFGAFEAVRLGTVPAGAAVVSIECSKALVSAPQGDGAVVRIGDASSVFSPRLSDHLWATRPDGVPAQRKLMDGGTCEATAFMSRGIEATGVCVPLAGYHNQPDDPGVRGPVAESILVADYIAEIDLLAALLSTPAPDDDRRSPSRYDQLAARAREALAARPL